MLFAHVHILHQRRKMAADEVKNVRNSMVGVNIEWKVFRFVGFNTNRDRRKVLNNKTPKKIISRSSKKFWRKYFEIVFWTKPLFKCHAMNIFYFPGFGVCSLLSRWSFDHSMAIKRMPWNIIKVHSQIIDVHKKKVVANANFFATFTHSSKQKQCCTNINGFIAIYIYITPNY